MRIGFDGKRAVCNNTGLGNYSRLLINVLAEEFPEHEYVLYTPKMRANPRLEEVVAHHNVNIKTPDSAISRATSAIWRLNGVTSQLKRDNINLMHGLSGELPLNIGKAPMPSVVTIHDLIFRRHPECYKAIDRTIYDYKFRKACQNATRILAISECTKRDVMNDYGISEDKIDVVYQGCAAQFHRTPTAEDIAAVKQKYGITKPYIISVGTIERRKNQILAAKGLRGVPEDFDLVLVGRRTPYADEIDQYIGSHNLRHRVKFIENAAFTDLPALYAGAECSSYTSRYEGFGIPVIESLNVGTPVVVGRGSCLEEAGGPQTPAVNPDDADAWIDTMTQLLNNPAKCKQIVTAGREYVQRFNDEAMANGTMECYKRALASF